MPTLDPNALPQKVKRLQTNLARLRGYPLPADLHQVVQEALQELAQMANDLQTSLSIGQAKEHAEQSRLAALFRVSQALGTSLNLNEVLNQVMDAVINLTGAERGFLVLLDPTVEISTRPLSVSTAQHLPEYLHIHAARNYSRETLEPKDIEVSRTVIRSVLESGEGVVTTDARSDPRFSRQESVLLYALRSILCAPLKARGQIIGVIYIDNRAQAGLFTNEDLRLLNAFAVQAAIAIENARLYTRADQALAERVAELETLTHIDRQLNARLDFDHVLEITRHWAIQGAGAMRCWIALYPNEPKTGAPQFYASAPPCDDLPAEASQAVDQAWQSLTPQSLPPSAERPAYLATPILHSGKPIGVLVVCGPASWRKGQARPEPFPSSAQHFLDRLAGRAANAIENARLYQAIQETNQAKSKFVSLVTHELRIPMTSIKGYTDLLRQKAVGPVNEQQLHFLDIIRNNVDRMSTLVAELSDISRIESGQMKLDLAFIALPGYLDEAVQNLRHKFEEKQQTLEISLPAGLPMVYADANRVVQILTNLLSNAWKYTPERGRIRVCVIPDGHVVKVEVRDTGVGISPQDQSLLFTQFFRSEDPAVREQPGWGLGLNITKKLVELMGGEIGVQSQLAQGSCFWFTLPTERTDER